VSSQYEERGGGALPPLASSPSACPRGNCPANGGGLRAQVLAHIADKVAGMQLPPALPAGPAQLSHGAACAARRVRRRAAPPTARIFAGVAPTPEAYRAAAVAIKEVVDLELLRQQVRQVPLCQMSIWQS
jgi:hypothetical protein